MLKVNSEYYTWKELVNTFPNRWVVVENAILGDGGFIKSGDLIGMCVSTMKSMIS